MKILTIERDDKDIPQNISEKTLKIGKLIEYLFNTKDEELIKESSIDRFEIYDKYFVKIYFNDKSMAIFDYSVIEWLKTHHYIYKAKFAKEEAEKLYDLIDGKIDWFIVEDWYIKNKTSFHHYTKGEVTYDKNFIYVKGKNIGLKTTSEMVEFVISNVSKWY